MTRNPNIIFFCKTLQKINKRNRCSSACTWQLFKFCYLDVFTPIEKRNSLSLIEFSKLLFANLLFAIFIKMLFGMECCISLPFLLCLLKRSHNAKNSNAICPNRPSQNEYRKRIPVRLHQISVFAKLRA